MDRIFIQNLAAHAVIGTLPEERQRRQRIVFDVELEIDLARAAADDDLGATVDYSALELELVRLAENSAFSLLEALAGAAAELILAASPRIAGCRVRIAKPGASRHGARIAVELERSRSHE